MSERGQVQRFLAVLRHLHVEQGDSVLDYGCGTGRLCEFLPDRVGYFAHDWSLGMLERVSREHPTAHIVSALGVEMYDHVVAVGPFNLVANWSKEETWDRLAELWGFHVRRSMLVSLYRGDDPLNLYYSPDELYRFTQRMGCRKYVIDATYLPNDVLLGMYR